MCIPLRASPVVTVVSRPWASRPNAPFAGQRHLLDDADTVTSPVGRHHRAARMAYAVLEVLCVEPHYALELVEGLSQAASDLSVTVGGEQARPS